jgi:hypothetical protein
MEKETQETRRRWQVFLHGAAAASSDIGIYLSKFRKRRWCLSDVISIVDVFHTSLLMKAATVVVRNRDILASVQQHGRTGAPCCSSGSWNHLIGSYAPYYIASNKDTKVLIMFFFSPFFPVARDERKGKNTKLAGCGWWMPTFMCVFQKALEQELKQYHSHHSFKMLSSLLFF